MHWLPLFLLLARPPHDTVVQVSFTFPTRYASATGDTLYYNPQRPLQLSDFTAPARSYGRSGAVSFTSFSYEGSSRLRHDTLQLRLFLQVFFVKSASWVLPGMATPATLAHEQLHFDLTYLVAVRFRQKILAATLPADDYDSILQYEYLEAYREMNRVQDAYDAGTHSGTDSWQQHAWAALVAGWLQLAAQGQPVPALEGPH
ncbi:MAG TPA: hypothetical protein VGC22_06365 [Chitinophaga sp.]